MDDAVSRLRERSQNTATVFALRDALNDAKNEIDRLTAAVEECDAEIERLRSQLEQSQAQTKAWKEDAGRQAMFVQKRPTPTLAEVAMHALVGAMSSEWGSSATPTALAKTVSSASEALLAELKRREG